jgi:hypothetical protein
MRKIREVLRLRFELGLGQRAIARACSISQSRFMNTSTGPPQAVWCGRSERSGTSSVSSRHCSESGRW